MKKKIVHKYISHPAFLCGTTIHLCGFQKSTPLNRIERMCCAGEWENVTCKKCLKKKETYA